MKTKISFIIIVIISCYIIYKLTNNSQTYVVALGDSSCLASSIYGVKGKSYNYFLSDHLQAKLNDNFCYKNQKIADLYRIMVNNDKQILKELDQANYITIMIGYDEFVSYKKISNLIKRDFLNDYNKLLTFINNNSKAKIIVIGYYQNYFQNVEEINHKLQIISENHAAIFIKPVFVTNNDTNFYNIKYYNLNEQGNKAIFNLIKEKL